MSLSNRSYTATGDVNPSRFVSLVYPYTVRQALSGDECIGISGTWTRRFDATLHAADTETVRVFGPNEEALLTLAGSVTAGDYLKPHSDGSGKGVTTSLTGTGHVGVGAIALTSGSSGETIQVRVTILSGRMA